MSPLIVQKAVERSNLAELPSLRKSKDPADDVLDCVQVKRSAGDDRSIDNVFDIVVKRGDRKEAVLIADAIVDAYREYLHERNVGRISADITTATSDLQRRIDLKRDEYRQFRASAPISLKAPVRGKNGERISVATNIYQENLEAVDKERQLILVKKAETQAKLQAIDSAMATGTSREELVASIRLFAAPQSSRTGTIDDARTALGGGARFTGFATYVADPG